ncbi:glycosyltransferase [Aeromicrobium sp.]|uniref:glycosyltransferase family 2 protein n=1 Tax=Aeromicrobium sp. TaxID=1871063 RepID=UPI001990DDF3|nr:glycosyltransferase [Aeromicrobium sp.]MBC7631146.1 glycosyltransferase [Aeromicrobium sp.]
MPGRTDDTVPPSLADLANARVVSPAAVTKTALRYEYMGVEPLLAHLASDGCRTYANLLELARRHASHVVATRADLDGLSSPALYALAQLTVCTATDGAAVSRAADLFALARSVAGRGSSAHHEHPDLELQTLLAAGRLENVREHLNDAGIDPWIRWAVSADLANPFGNAPPQDTTTWLNAFNRPFIERGLAPLQLGLAATPFEGLTSAGAALRAGTVDGPLVTIVVPVFQPDQSLVLAVRSLIEQTWGPLQIVLVDDASPAEFEPVLAQARGLDERIEYVRMPTNGGAYRARNLGIAHARGEFVGIQDSDDWSHPDRIARQMHTLMTQPAVVATLSKAIWLHRDLTITRPGTKPFARIAPSLLFRRKEVLRRLGAFDVMRKGADTEFIERLSATFGCESVVTLEEPLTLYQLTQGSLSRADFRTGWRHDARVSYHSAFRQWHREISAGRADPSIEPGSERPFAAPPEMTGGAHPTKPIDVVVLADMRSHLLDSTGLPPIIEALASAGLEVGLARGEALRHAKVARELPQPAVQRLVTAGLAAWRPLSADLTPRLLLVRDPDLLSLPRVSTSVGMRPERVVVVADRFPAPGERPRISYEPNRIERIGREQLGREVEWLPATTDIAAELRAAGATGKIHPSHLAESAQVSRHPGRSIVGPPVIGVSDSSPYAVERADRRRLSTRLPTGDAYDIRILESSDRPTRHPGPSWLGFGPSTIGPFELLDQCDFFVGLTPLIAGVNVLRPIIDAMARGCVVIVQPEHERLLGDAALYLGARSVTELVDQHWKDPDLFSTQQRQSLAFCQNELSAEALASVILQLTGTEHTS